MVCRSGARVFSKNRCPSRVAIIEKRERQTSNDALGRQARQPARARVRTDASRQRDSSRLFVRVRPASANLGPLRRARSTARAVPPNENRLSSETFPTLIRISLNE